MYEASETPENNRSSRCGRRSQADKHKSKNILFEQSANNSDRVERLKLALAYVHENTLPAPNKKFSIKDIVGDGILLAVPKFRRTVERRWKRKYGSPEYVWKMLVPKTDILVCQECGHHHEKGRLCENCYKRVEKETKLIKEKILENLGTKPIDKDVVVLYEGENLPDKPKEFWNGKRIIEMKKERPQWFSKNLLQKTTQAPSEATDIKPTDLA